MAAVVCTAFLGASTTAVGQPAEGPPPTRWQEELARFAALDAAAAPQPGGICLLGSSNIGMWNTLTEDLPGMNVVNRGVGGCRLVELAEHAPAVLAGVKPRVIVVSAGTNDVSAGLAPAEVRAAFEKLVANVRRDSPQAKIVFLAISPTPKRWDQFDRQQAANAAVRDFIAAAGNGLSYLDTNAAFLGPDGQPAPECFLEDRQHPSRIGNARRAEIMRPVLKRLLDE